MKTKLIMIAFLFLCLGCAASLVGTKCPDTILTSGFYKELMEGDNQVLWYRDSTIRRYGKVEFEVIKGRGYIIQGNFYMDQPALGNVVVGIMDSDFIIIAHVLGTTKADVSSPTVGCPFSVYIDASQYDFSKFKYVTFGFG